MAEKGLYDEPFEDFPVPEELEPKASRKPEVTDADRIRERVSLAQKRVAGDIAQPGDLDLIKEYAGKPALMDHIKDRYKR